MKSLREQHEDLESKVHGRFSELVNALKEDLNFLKNEEDELMDCEIVEVYSEMSGSTYSNYIIGFSKGGMIKIIDLEGDAVENVRFSDLSSTLDKITAVELLENFI